MPARIARKLTAAQKEEGRRNHESFLAALKSGNVIRTSPADVKPEEK